MKHEHWNKVKWWVRDHPIVAALVGAFVILAILYNVT